MPKWLRRIRGAVGMGMIWAVAWAPIGLLIGEIVDPDGSMDEPWMLVGTLPGFVGGVIFSVVLGIAARSRRFDQLSIPRFGVSPPAYTASSSPGRRPAASELPSATGARRPGGQFMTTTGESIP